MKQLPERLQAIARFIPRGKRVADIGTDHALLPIFLVKEGISPEVIASDLNKGPLEAARKNVVTEGLWEHIILRLGNGLTTIKSGEADVAVIAGMGGGTIRSILELCGSQVPVNQLVLQPMGDSGILRKWLAGNGWKFENEDIIEEDNRIYEIISVIPGVEDTTDADIISLGPRLVEKQHPLLQKIIDWEIEKNRKIMLELENSNNRDSAVKCNNLSKRNQRLEWISKCLLNAKQ